MDQKVVWHEIGSLWYMLGRVKINANIYQTLSENTVDTASSYLEIYLKHLRTQIENEMYGSIFIEGIVVIPKDWKHL